MPGCAGGLKQCLPKIRSNNYKILSYLLTRKKKLMRRFLVLFCTLALACVGYAAHEEHKPEPKKKEAKPAEHSEHKPEPKKKETRPAEHAAVRQRHPANINKPSTRALKPVTQSSPRPRNLTPSPKPL